MKPGQQLLLILLAALGSVGCTSGPQEVMRLEGAGSTFINPIMQEWASKYKGEKNVQINYQSKGSGAGIKMMTDKEVDFGGSDAPLNEEQLAAAEKVGGEVAHIPLCMGAVVPAYNLPGIDDLVLSGEVLVKIYLGDVKRWNHEAIVKLNKGKKLPDTEIAVTYRSDGSGTTYVFTDYLTKIDKQAWTAGKGVAVRFPCGAANKGNPGVAGFVKNTEGAVGYLELTYALTNKIPFAAVINAAGKPIKADIKSVTAAAVTAKIPADLRFSITNSTGESVYPIAGASYALVYVKQPPGKGKPLAEFLTWVTHQGQKLCEEHHYAPLPQVLVMKIEEKLKKIEAGQ